MTSSIFSSSSLSSHRALILSGGSGARRAAVMAEDRDSRDVLSLSSSFRFLSTTSSP
eukprot:CAMPEP_0197547098 /NCGR_PEP_ID=MMETSP1320-20131121/1523_1 /TAXON_ID=91990 /ORGANISM="Bolidomonas sp., Strain RCC2347" /LENGTH=56 /DNA_ID=CAMNT_0043106795 /DNA_START=2 /DNA_END=168 /DNA_ORIENTATION=+